MSDALIRSNFRRDPDGRLKLKGHSKTSKEGLMLLLARLTGLADMNRTELIEQIEQYANETDAELQLRDGQGLSVEDGALQVTATVNPELMAVIAEGLLEQMEAAGGSNYVEWSLNSTKTGEQFTLLLQRGGKITPAQRFGALRTDIENLRDSWGQPIRAASTIKKKMAANVLQVILDKHATKETK